jgi:sRNA-binding regulator protein Hfq
LIEKKTRVVIRMRDNEEFEGTLEYYDKTFIRLTRGEEPNLFIFKHDIKYLYEVPVEAGAQSEEEPASKADKNEGNAEPRANYEEDDDREDDVDNEDDDEDEYDDDDDEDDDDDDDEEDDA